MIGRLRGMLLEVRGNRVVVDCGGVGYETTVSAYTLAALPREGEAIDLRVFTHVTDRTFNLFGFGSEAERQLFDLLITVKNVGPGTAVGILSGGATPTELAQLIAAEQTAALKKLKGVGKKTAELLVVELHEKCELLLATWGAGGAAVAPVAGVGPKPPSDRPPILDAVASALIQLGWRKIEVDKVIDEIELTGDEELETLLRQAMRNMPKR